MAKILISADMEGIAGITHRKQVLRDSPEFARSCRLMTAEVAAACEGALEGGATAVVVNDSHSDMRNLMSEELPPQVEVLSGNTKLWSMVHGIDTTFDGIAFLGYHAPAASIAGILDHTYHGSVVHEVRLNGEPMSEARLNALVAHPVAGPLMRGMRHIPVDRSAGADAYRAAVSALASGELVGVFPEATISRSWCLKGFKTGAVRMAQAAEVPVVPLVIWGSHRVLTKGRPRALRAARGTPITLVVGEPMPMPADADPAVLTAELQARMAALLDEAQRTYPVDAAGAPWWLPRHLGGSAPTPAEADELDATDAAARAARRAAR